MEYLVIICGVVFVICVLIIEAVFYNKIQMMKIRMDEAENNIDILLQKKYKILVKGITAIKDVNKKYKDEPIIEYVNGIEKKKFTNYKFNNELVKIETEFKNFVDLDKKLSNNDIIMNVGFDLTEANNELNAAKKYYNKHTVLYNRYVKCFPSNILSLIFKFKVKEFYSEETAQNLEILKEASK